MKWLTRKKATKTVQPDTFLVLPMLENNNNNLTGAMPTGVRLFTKKLAVVGTWPPKNQEKKKRKKGEELQRPLTATLERPQLLNIKLISTLDMSKVRKEFLCISNLCSIPITELRNRRKTGAGDRRRSIPRRPLSLPNNGLKLSAKSPKRPDPGGDESWEDEESSYREKPPSKKSIKLKLTSGIPKKQAKQSSVRDTKQTNSDSNNNTSNSSAKTTSSVKSTTSSTINSKKVVLVTAAKQAKPTVLASAVDGVFGGIVSQRKVPEPCKTCGRPDQPERFHSHPISPVKPKEPPAKKLQMKSTVQKPVAIRFKSKKSSESGVVATITTGAVAPTPKAPTQKVAAVKSPKVTNKNDVRILSAGKGPRTLTCYLCGREFGSASLPLHEPKCLEKWERENSLLPANMRRKAPTKPDKPLSTEEWNEFAWKASQASLTPCKNCGRTFLPDRLLVHLRSCKPGVPRISPSQSNSNLKPVTKETSKELIPAASPSRTKTNANPTTIPCYVCGRMFGTKSIGIHEPQCLKKWHMQNDHLPSDQREPVPLKPAPTPKSTPEPDEGPDDPQTSKIPVASSKESDNKPPLFPCYLCGRLFDVNTIYAHEPECLKKWREENEKLSPNKRRQEPLKPDIKFTPSGGVDYVGTYNRVWENHLNELVECKICRRKFFPDRIETHEAACNGLKIKLKNSNN